MLHTVMEEDTSKLGGNTLAGVKTLAKSLRSKSLADLFYPTNKEIMKTLDQFKKIIKWYAEEKLDQYDQWKLDTKFGRVYITFSRKPYPCEDKHYNYLNTD